MRNPYNKIRVTRVFSQEYSLENFLEQENILDNCILTCSCTCPLLYWPTVIYLWYLIWHGVSLVTNCLCRKKHKHQEGKLFGCKWWPSSVPTILICIKNKTYTLDRQNPCKLNNYFCFFLVFLFLTILFKKIELHYANRPSSLRNPLLSDSWKLWNAERTTSKANNHN